MHLKSKRLYLGLVLAVLAVLAVGLGSSTAEARKKDPLAQCRGRCDRMIQEAKDKLLQCLQDCPKPRAESMEAFQVCTQSCGKKHPEPSAPSCVSKCDSGELDAEAKRAKKGKKKAEPEHSDEEPTHVRPATSR